MSKPMGRTAAYGAVLYIEKEGFMALLDEVKLAQRFDHRHHVVQRAERHRRARAGR